MTDDLVTEARKGGPCAELGDRCRAIEAASGCFCAAVADRIEQLQAQNLRLSGMCHDLKKEVAISDALLISEGEASLERLARAEKTEADNARLRAALLEERTETLWNAYNTGMEQNGRWRHMCMSDGEWLERECGLDNSQPDHPADAVKAAIPLAAERFVAALNTGKETK